MSKTRVDYRVTKSETTLSADELNTDYGAFGYELVSILPSGDGFEYVFKRVNADVEIKMQEFTGKQIDGIMKSLAKDAKRNGSNL